jgi:hypothetical protein
MFDMQNKPPLAALLFLRVKDFLATKPDKYVSSNVQVLPILDANPAVERYAWYLPRAYGTDATTSLLEQNTSTLSLLGNDLIPVFGGEF